MSTKQGCIRYIEVGFSHPASIKNWDRSGIIWHAKDIAHRANLCIMQATLYCEWMKRKPTKNHTKMKIESEEEAESKGKKIIILVEEMFNDRILIPLLQHRRSQK
jgi:hypothetical protein